MVRKYIFISTFCFIILTFFFFVVGVSFAVFNYNKDGNISNVLSSGTVDLKLDLNNKKLSLNNTNDINHCEVYSFNVLNNGSLSVKYKINIMSDVNSLVNLSDISYSLEKNGTFISNGNFNDQFVLTSDFINGFSSNSYVLNICNLKSQGEFFGNVTLDYVSSLENFATY